MGSRPNTQLSVPLCHTFPDTPGDLEESGVETGVRSRYLHQPGMNTTRGIHGHAHLVPTRDRPREARYGGTARTAEYD